QAFAFRVVVGFVDAGDGPVAAAEGFHSAGADVFVQHVDEFADWNIGVVAVHQIQVGVIGLQAIEADEQLPGDRVRIALGRVRAFGYDDEVVSNAADFQPVTEVYFVLAAAVDEGGV